MMKLGKMNEMSPDGKMTKLQFIKWLLTCGLVPYESFEHGDDGKEACVLRRCRIGHSHLTQSYLLKGEDPPEFRDEAEAMVEADTTDTDTMTGMVEVSLSNTSCDRALTDVSGLPSGHHAADENELFYLITLKKGRKNKI